MNRSLYRQYKSVVVVFNVWTALCGDPTRQMDTAAAAGQRAWCCCCRGGRCQTCDPVALFALQRAARSGGGRRADGLLLFFLPFPFRERRLSFTASAAAASELQPAAAVPPPCCAAMISGLESLCLRC